MSASSTKALVGAMAANLAIAATKFLVGGITGSTVMIAEGIHSLVDTGDSALMLPLFEGISLAIGVREFSAYRREKHFKGSMLAVMRASKNPAIFVTVLEDSAALIGLAIAAAGLTLSRVLAMPRFDAVASILIGLVLMAEAGLLGYECRGLIIGEPARALVVAGVRRVLSDYAAIGRIVELRTLQLGPDSVMLVLGIRLDGTMTAGDIQALTTKLGVDVRRLAPSVKHIVYDLAPSSENRQPPDGRS